MTSAVCSCQPGYTGDPEQGGCLPVDPCRPELANCGVFADCAVEDSGEQQSGRFTYTLFTAVSVKHSYYIWICMALYIGMFYRKHILLSFTN